MNCMAGKHETMLQTLATEAGARAYAGTGVYNTFYGYSLGEYRMAYPGGPIITTSRPRHWGLGG